MNFTKSTELTFTLFGSAFGAHAGFEITETWQRWTELLTSKVEADERTTKDGPGMVLGELRDQHRNRSKLICLHALGLDLDPPKGEFTLDPAAWTEALTEALRTLEPYEYVAYSTYSSTEAVPRYRVILPLEQPATADEYDAAWLQLHQLTGRTLDSRARDASRLHYLPAYHPDRAEAWESFHHEGIPFPIPNVEPAPAPAIAPQKPRQLVQAELNAEVSFLRDWLVSRTQALARIKEVAKAVALGAPFGEEGGRHEAALHLTAVIAAKYKPTPSPEVIEELFAESHRAMTRTQQDVPALAQIVEGYVSAVEKFAPDPHKVEVTQDSYTPEQLALISERQGSPHSLSKRWIVAHRDAYWFLNEDGDYVGPYMAESKDVAMLQCLRHAPVSLWSIHKDGRRLRAVKEVLAEAGTVVLDAVDDLTAQVTTLTDATLRVAPCPRRPLAAQHSADIDKWLRLLGGSCYPKLVDWLSVVPDLNQMLCALYFDGAPGTGKTLFAQGVASIWADAVTKFEDFQADFNDSLKKCPIVFADEEVPNNSFKRSSATTLIREMITTKQRSVREKFRPTSNLFGAIRLILAANSDTLLTWKDAASSHDLEALGQRILYINPSRAAADHLLAMGKDVCNYWQREGFARHVLWLHENHKIKQPGGRLVVEGDVSRLHRTMMTGSPITSAVIEILVRYLLNPKAMRAVAGAPIARSGGELLVNVDAIRLGWRLLDRTNENPPNTTALGRALRSIAHQNTQGVERRMAWKNRRVRVVSIDTEHLISWAELQSVASRDELVEALSIDDTEEESYLTSLDAENEMEDPV